MAQEVRERAHLLHLDDLLPEIVEGELLFAELAGHLLGLGDIGLVLGLLDERQDVPHAQDARGHALGVKDLELVGFLADADELDGPAGRGDDRQGRSAPGVAVELGQDDRGQADLLLEGLGAAHGVLARHGVADIDHFDGGEDVLDQAQLIHQLVVDVEAARRVDDEGIEAAVGRVGQ